MGYDTYNFYDKKLVAAAARLASTKIHLDQSYLPYA